MKKAPQAKSWMTAFKALSGAILQIKSKTMERKDFIHLRPNLTVFTQIQSKKELNAPKKIAIEVANIPSPSEYFINPNFLIKSIGKSQQLN